MTGLTVRSPNCGFLHNRAIRRVSGPRAKGAIQGPSECSCRPRMLYYYMRAVSLNQSTKTTRSI